MSFSWKPIYREIAERVRPFSSRSPELAALVIEMRREGLKVIPTRDLEVGDVEIEIEDIDPFSFFACFNRNATDANRQQILSWLKRRWGLESAVPEDFNGLPLVNPQRSWYMLYKKNRKAEHIPLLWRFYETLFDLDSPFELDTSLFDQCCLIPGVKPTNLTMGMFWIRPDLFFALDRKNLSKAEILGLESAYDWPRVPGLASAPAGEVPRRDCQFLLRRSRFRRRAAIGLSILPAFSRCGPCGGRLGRNRRCPEGAGIS